MKESRKFEKLTKAELEFMEYSWSSEGKKTLQDYVEHFSDKNWERPTVSTYLHRLFQKGFLSYEKKGRYYYYEPIVTKLEYEQFQINQSMRQMFGLPLEGVIASFYGKRKLSRKQLEQIKNFLEELDAEEE